MPRPVPRNRYRKGRSQPSRNAQPHNPPPSVEVRSTIPGYPGMVRIDMVAKADAKARKPEVQPDPPEPKPTPKETHPVSSEPPAEPRFGARLGRPKD